MPRLKQSSRFQTHLGNPSSSFSARFAFTTLRRTHNSHDLPRLQKLEVSCLQNDAFLNDPTNTDLWLMLAALDSACCGMRLLALPGDFKCPFDLFQKWHKVVYVILTNQRFCLIWSATEFLDSNCFSSFCFAKDKHTVLVSFDSFRISVTQIL